MKILYIEDEQTVALNKMRILFSKYITKDIDGKIEELLVQSVNTGYGIDPEDLKKIIESTETIEFEYDFTKAMKKLIAKSDKYSLIIADRNLLGKETHPAYNRKSMEELNLELPKFDFETYKGREGDYIFHYLFCQMGIKILDKFYFLTAYSDEIIGTGKTHLDLYVDLKILKENNFIIKAQGVEDSFKNDIIDNLDELDLINQNKRYIKILKTIAEEEASKFFLKVLKNKDISDEFSENLWNMRVILENLLKKLATQWFSAKTQPIYKKNGELNITEFIKWLIESGKVSEKDRILRSFFDGFYKICSSEYATHRDFNFPRPSTDVVNSLFYQLKEIIVWYGTYAK
jgi:hypothetical protein